MSVKTRFAPSPTGSLHLGSARTALFAWAYAKHQGGEFLLRIEDTDKVRSEQRHVETILQSMAWLGLDYQSEPVYQSARTQRYRQVLETLLASGQAYRCTCSKARLDALREQQLQAKCKPRYDRHCREQNLVATDTPHVIRFKNPLSGYVTFNDHVRGEISVANSELDDLILWRSDDTPTYNFTVVVDDKDMGITHVIRGDDHINNTPRQLNLFAALDAQSPAYAHIPMILGPDMKKLSKRHGALSVLEYRDDGILADAMVNYLARLGWAHGDDEIFSRQQFIDWFDIAALNRAASAFDPEKLHWVNQHYLQHGEVAAIVPELTRQFELAGVDVSGGPALDALFDVQKTRCKTLKDMAQRSQFFYQADIDYDEKACEKHLNQQALSVINYMEDGLQSIDWTKESIKEVVSACMQSLDLKMGHVAQPLRVALTGTTQSPSIDDTILLMGKVRTLERLAQARTCIRV